jgi:hypothetical protein
MAELAIQDDETELEIPAGDAGDQTGDQAQADPPEGDDGDEDEVLIGFEGEEGAPAQGEQDSSLIRRLREEVRKRDAELKVYRTSQPSQPQVIEVGPKPTFESCEFDEGRYETELDAWKERDAKAKQAEADALKVQAAQQETWNKELAEVETQKSQLKVKDYDQAAEVVQATFDVQQQAMIVRASINKARMVYALGKSPAKAAELAKITDPVKFIAEVARMEGKVTVQRKSAPPPEQITRGSAPLSNAVDKHLEKLEAEFQRTGDRTKIVQYKREQKAKGR